MTPTEAHPPTHLLAELAEGVVDDEGAVQAHVEQCPHCQGVVEQLGQVTVALRSLPAAVPVPGFVSARISAALTAERSAVRPSDAVLAGAVPAGDVTGDDQGTVAWFRRRVPQALAAAASVAVIGLAGYVAVTSDGGNGSGGGELTAAEARSSADSDSAAEAPQLADEAESGRAPADGMDAAPGDTEIDREELAVTVADVYDRRSDFAPSCGQELSDELGQPVVGSAAAGAGVLVVLEDEADDQLDGWLVQTCHSLTQEALDAPVVVPIPRDE